MKTGLSGSRCQEDYVHSVIKHARFLRDVDIDSNTSRYVWMELLGKLGTTERLKELWTNEKEIVKRRSVLNTLMVDRKLCVKCI